MTKEFSFGHRPVAGAYNTVLVPVLFEPWAIKLVQENGSWEGMHVLDLATGTGIVAEQLKKEVGANGKVIGADINNQMLEFAKERVPGVEFIECSAESLTLATGSVDAVVCQQGFQFFPDKLAAAKEVYRVLRPQGKVIVTTWRPVKECEFFGSICKALEAMGEQEIANLMRVPFDFMPVAELQNTFEQAGFKDISISQQKKDLIVNNKEHSVEVAYATPIGPKLRELSEEKQKEFKVNLLKEVETLSNDDQTMGRMVTNVLTAGK